MPQRVKVTLSLEVDALDLLNQAISERKRGWYVSQLLRQALGEKKSLAVTEVIAALREFEGALLQQAAGHRGLELPDALPAGRGGCRVKERIGSQ